VFTAAALLMTPWCSARYLRTVVKCYRHHHHIVIIDASLFRNSFGETNYGQIGHASSKPNWGKGMKAIVKSKVQQVYYICVLCVY